MTYNSENEYTERVYSIPQNFDDGVNIPFINIRVNPRRLIEAAIMTAFPLIYVLFIANFESMTSKLASLLAYCIPVFVFGCFGINGDPISVFIKNYYRYITRRGTMLYNPAVKSERKISDVELLAIGETSNGSVLRTFMSVEDKYDPEENEIVIDDDELLTSVVFEEPEKPDKSKQKIKKKKGAKK